MSENLHVGSYREVQSPMFGEHYGVRNPGRLCAAIVRNCNLPNRRYAGLASWWKENEIRPHRPDRMHPQLRGRHVGPKHDDANRRQEDEAEKNERDIFQAEAMATLFHGARRDNMKARALR